MSNDISIRNPKTGRYESVPQNVLLDRMVEERYGITLGELDEVVEDADVKPIWERLYDLW